MRALLLLLLIAAAGQPAEGQHWRNRRSDQMSAWEQRREGRLLPLREIEARVVPQMRGAQYLGCDFDGEAGVYTLRFLRDGAVIQVDVDGRTGQIIGRSGR